MKICLNPEHRGNKSGERCKSIKVNWTWQYRYKHLARYWSHVLEWSFCLLWLKVFFLIEVYIINVFLSSNVRYKYELHDNWDKYVIADALNPLITENEQCNVGYKTNINY